MAMLCKNLKPEGPMVWVQDQFLPVSTLICSILYVFKSAVLLILLSDIARIGVKLEAQKARKLKLEF